MIGGDRRFAHLRVPPSVLLHTPSHPHLSVLLEGNSPPATIPPSLPPLRRFHSLRRVSRSSHIGFACQALEGLQHLYDAKRAIEKREKEESRGAGSFWRWWRQQTDSGVWVTRLAERRDAEGTRKRASCLRRSLPASLHISVMCRAASGRSFVHSISRPLVSALPQPQ
ncbi:hypothetical protein E2C01_009905 [Portunus trituberculatus]|uniref:Uncharacterized protein n=1 Tax=Portunus trituberculatus TaxID=210409 RepID=A0A5B7D6Z0_PORTR|nr:hypothetical protein [Portunus trituberculatus]